VKGGNCLALAALLACTATATATATAAAAEGGRADRPRMERLFTTVEEREELDNIRANYRPERAEESGDGGGTLTVNGVLLRSSGRNAAWVNGRSNILEEPACRQAGEIEKIKDYFKRNRGRPAMTTGSGPTVFVITKDRDEAREIRDDFFKWIRTVPEAEDRRSAAEWHGDWRAFIASTLI